MSTSLAGTPARFNASEMTRVPSSTADLLLNAPPMVPMGVRHAPARTTFLMCNGFLSIIL